MLFSDINLPEKLSQYLEEIYGDLSLRDAFYSCDIDIYSPESLLELISDKSLWLEPGEPNYEIKPFAGSADGGFWVVLNDEYIGYIGSEGECGIVARNVDEFMNIIAVCKFLDLRVSSLKNEESFIESIDEANEEFEYQEVFDRFIEKHKFEKDISTAYKLLKLGLTVKPFFEIKATDDEYCDSYSLLGADDGQQALEKFIADYL